MDKFCSHCGSPLIEGAKFCAKCGKKVDSSSGEVDFASDVEYSAFSNGDYYDEYPAYEHTIEEMYFSHRGRLNRKRYFFRSIISSVAFAVLLILSISVPPAISRELAVFIPLWIIPLVIASIVCAIKLTIRRCHDLDKSGWFCLFLFVPVADIIVSLYLLFAKGTTGPNRYGPDPLAIVPLMRS